MTFEEYLKDHKYEIDNVKTIKDIDNFGSDDEGNWTNLLNDPDHIIDYQTYT